jgi:hypothetical protein
VIYITVGADFFYIPLTPASRLNDSHNSMDDNACSQAPTQPPMTLGTCAS